MKTLKKLSLLQKRRWRIRKKINGTAERPRLAVHFSNKNIIVVGGSRGIGFEVAEAFKKSNASVKIISSKICDISKKESIDKYFKNYKKKLIY